MFAEFFYTLRDRGIPVSPTGFLRLQEALDKGLIMNLEDLYCISRAVMIKSERYFDMYDRVFAHYFKGSELPENTMDEIEKAIAAMLEEWLKDPAQMAEFLGMSVEDVKKLTPEELEEYFRQRLKDQTERHDGGNRWIGTGGTSPVGHSGFHPGGMRVGGASQSHSAVKVALERRYRDYSQDQRLGPAQISDALKRLRYMVPAGPKDSLNIEKTIRETMKNAGEIEIVFDRRLRDKLKVVLMIDNGGYSMDPFVNVVQVLFNHAKSQFKDVKFYFFHNTVYSRVYSDSQRQSKPFAIEDFARMDPETRLIIVGDASMAPYELYSRYGSIYYGSQLQRPSVETLVFLAKTFRHSVWLNPKHEYTWPGTETVMAISEIFPMYELTLNGLDDAVGHLMKK